MDWLCSCGSSLCLYRHHLIVICWPLVLPMLPLCLTLLRFGSYRPNVSRKVQQNLERRLCLVPQPEKSPGVITETPVSKIYLPPPNLSLTRWGRSLSHSITMPFPLRLQAVSNTGSKMAGYVWILYLLWVFLRTAKSLLLCLNCICDCDRSCRVMWQQCGLWHLTVPTT